MHVLNGEGDLFVKKVDVGLLGKRALDDGVEGKVVGLVVGEDEEAIIISRNTLCFTHRNVFEIVILLREEGRKKEED